MAAKKTAKKGQTTKVLGRLQSNMKRLQRDAEAMLGRTRKQATQLIGRDQRRALDRLLKQARQLRSDMEKRAERAARAIESRGERWRRGLEKEARERLGAVLERLNMPSRQELSSLGRRISRLEQQLRARRASVKKATATTSPTMPVTPPVIERTGEPGSSTD